MPKPTLIGPDLSHYNPSVDWSVLGSPFVSLKCTEGTEIVDPKFAIRWARAKQKAKRRNAYHFFRPDEDPEEQASLFAYTLLPDSGEIPPTIDIESSNRLLTPADAANVLELRDAVSAITKRPTMIYTSRYMWDLLGNPDPGDSPLWVARYSDDDNPGALPQGFKSWLFWQFSDHGRLPGVEGNVDLDGFNGSADDLARLFPL